MKRGTKSLLFGVHQIFLHPCFVAWGWRRRYGGLPRDPRVWCAFALHDIGYLGCETMDGKDGKHHPLLGATLMHRLFDRPGENRWFVFTACHSRSAAALLDLAPSPLMEPDKLATALVPTWLYVAQCWLSGEGREYVALDQAHGYTGPTDLLSWARWKRRDWGSRFKGA